MWPEKGREKPQIIEAIANREEFIEETVKIPHLHNVNFLSLEKICFTHQRISRTMELIF